MNKELVLILLLFVCQINLAQNNISPTGDVGIGTTVPVSKLSIVGSVTINGGLNNTLARPAVSSGTSDYGEIRSYSMHGNLKDDGFLRLSAGGGTTPWAKTYIDLSGYSTVPDMDRNIVFGTSNSERMRINQVGNVGIGTLNATSLLAVGEYHGVKLSVGGANWVSKNILQTSWVSGIGDFTEINVVGQFANKASITLIENGNVGIGVKNPDSKLTVAGNIHAQEVKVTVNAGVPDYVFAKDYKLKSLQEVEEYIKQNSHLPEIPSAKEIEKNGLMLAEMNLNLLKKIEELTLHAIQQQKNITELTKIVEEQNKRLNSLESK